MLSFFCGACALWLAAVPPAPLSWTEIAALARPGVEQLETEAFLSAARSILAETSARLADGAALGLTVGPRSGDEGDSTDLALEVEVPLLAASHSRRDLIAAVAAVGPILRTAADALAAQRLHGAYLDAWLIAARLQVRRNDVSTLERWFAVARRRVEGGAEPPLEAALIEADLVQARAALTLARGEERRAWGELAALTAVPSEPVPLAPPGAPQATPLSEGLPERFARGARLQAVAGRGALRALLLEIEDSRQRSRLSLRSSLEREGDQDVARVGIAYRLPRRRENEALDASLAAARGTLAREVELESAALAGRFAAALEVAASLAADVPGPRLDEALSAVELRLAEGKDRPSQALLVRRQLLGFREASLERRAALGRAHAELVALTTEVEP